MVNTALTALPSRLKRRLQDDPCNSGVRACGGHGTGALQARGRPAPTLRGPQWGHIGGLVLLAGLRGVAGGGSDP